MSGQTPLQMHSILRYEQAASWEVLDDLAHQIATHLDSRSVRAVFASPSRMFACYHTLRALLGSHWRGTQGSLSFALEHIGTDRTCKGSLQPQHPNLVGDVHLLWDPLVLWKHYQAELESLVALSLSVLAREADQAHIAPGLPLE